MSVVIPAGPPVLSPNENRVEIPVMTLWAVLMKPGRQNHVLSTHNDGERNAKVMRQPPVTLQLLLVPELGQTVLVAFLIAVRGPVLGGRVFCSHSVCWQGQLASIRSSSE